MYVRMTPPTQIVCVEEPTGSAVADGGPAGDPLRPPAVAGRAAAPVQPDRAVIASRAPAAITSWPTIRMDDNLSKALVKVKIRQSEAVVNPSPGSESPPPGHGGQTVPALVQALA